MLAGTPKSVVGDFGIGCRRNGQFGLLKRECFAEKVIGGEGKDAEVQKKEDAAEGDPAEQKKEHSEARKIWQKEKMKPLHSKKDKSEK